MHRCPLTKQCHTNHAHIARAARALGIAVGRRSKFKRGYIVVTFAPASNAVALVRTQHVACLRSVGRLAADHVNTVYRGDRQHAAAHSVANVDSVFSPRHARHPVFTTVVVQRQRGACIAVGYRYIGQPAYGQGGGAQTADGG